MSLDSPHDLLAAERMAHPLFRAVSASFNHTTSGSWVTVTGWTVSEDTHTQWTSASSIITFKVPGLYLLNANIQFPANATGQRGLRFLINGTTSIGSVLVNTASSGTTNLINTTLRRVVSGNTIACQAFQDSTGTLSGCVTIWQTIHLLKYA